MTALLPADWMPVVDEVCRKHRTDLRSMLADDRRPAMVMCRHETWWELNQRLGATAYSIGKQFGRHTTTVRYALLKWPRRPEVTAR